MDKDSKEPITEKNVASTTEIKRITMNKKDKAHRGINISTAGCISPMVYIIFANPKRRMMLKAFKSGAFKKLSLKKKSRCYKIQVKGPVKKVQLLFVL